MRKFLLGMCMIEVLLCSAQFAHESIIEHSEFGGATSIKKGDLDGDGTIDAIVTALSSPSLVWYPGDGMGGFEDLRVISSTYRNIRAADFGDLDNDGDQDVVAYSSQHLSVVWFENDGQENFSSPQTLASVVGLQTYSLHCEDLNADGMVDVLICAEDHTLLENFGGGTFGAAQMIMPQYTSHKAVTTDFDQDGDVDILYVAGNFVRWRMNDGSGNFSDPPHIANNGDGFDELLAADMDGDSDLDVLVTTAAGRIRWIRNDGVSFAELPIFTSLIQEVTSITVGDLDGDLDMDVVSTIAPNVFLGGQNGAVEWHLNDGNGTMIGQGWISNEVSRPRGILVHDIDSDQDVDLVVLADLGGYVCSFLNDGAGSFGPLQFAATSISQPVEVITADLNGDGFLDVVAGSQSDNKVAWFVNDGQGGFGAQVNLSINSRRPGTVVAHDVDYDGDLDLLCGARDDSKISLFTNDGMGVFSPEQVISNSAADVRKIKMADLNGDGWDDLVWAGDDLAYHLNDGSGVFGPVQQVAPITKLLEVADLDGDGDLDLIESFSNATIRWRANDGAGIFAPPTNVTSTFPTISVLQAHDVDADGDMDIVAGRGNFSGELGIFINDGAGSFIQGATIPLDHTPISLYCTDIDGDLDIDIVHLTQLDHELAWHPNDGSGNFGNPFLVVADTTVAYPSKVRGGDLDNDGDIDLVTAVIGEPSRVSWYENLMFVGVEEYSASQISCYPTLLTHSARLLSEEPLTSRHTINVIDSQGRLVRNMKGNGSNEMIIEKGQLAAGIYTIQVSAPGNVIHSARVVVQ